MSMAAALKAARAVELARQVVAIEMLCACQAIDLAGAARHVAAARARASIMFAHACRRSTTIARRRATSTRSPRLIARGELERACAMKVN